VAGVSFAPTGDLYVADAGQSSNPSLALGVNDPNGSELILTFDVDVFAFGADLFQNLGGGLQCDDDLFACADYPFTIAALGASGDVMMFHIGAPPAGGGFFGFLSAAPIRQVKISQAGGFAVIDNVSFGPGAESAVPEPATWTLLVLGFGYLGAALRKRRGVRLA
jgi:hypothetical protein